MVLFAQGTGKGDRSIDKRWREKARVAKERTMSLDEWSSREIARWDLDDPARKPTGVENPRTWRYDKPLRETNRISRERRQRDVRDNPRV